jgi:cob(I)alamin adenosyltransferase
MSIVTGSGDDGKTSLISGTRVPKHHPRLRAYGSVDEAQSAIGMARSLIHPKKAGETSRDFSELDGVLKKVQEELHTVGADLAAPDFKAKVPRVDKKMIDSIQAECGRLESRLPKLNSFILPTGTPAAATCFWARSVVRNAEREVSSLKESGESVTLVLVYLNRVGDLLFLVGRALNQASGVEDEVLK